MPYLFMVLIFLLSFGGAVPGAQAADEDWPNIFEEQDKPAKDHWSKTFDEHTPKEDRIKIDAPRRDFAFENAWSSDKKRKRLGDVQRDQLKTRGDD